MSIAVPQPEISAPERLARLIDGLCDAVAARGVGGRLTAALLILLWGRLRRTALRVRRLAARIAAGDPLIARRQTTRPRPGRKSPPRLPCGAAWLVRLAPATAVCGAQLRHLLTDPDMAALARTAPMRRLLRPLCQMLGVPKPPIPKRPAVAQPPPPPSAGPAPPHPVPPAWVSTTGPAPRRPSAPTPARPARSPSPT